MRLQNLLVEDTKYKKSRVTLFIMAVLILTTVFVIDFSSYEWRVEAGTSHNMSGYAWSDTVGWVSFNCLDANSCSTVDYGVGADESTGNLSGYAWSPNIGWISFNQSDLSGCPSGTCTATLTGSSLTGWAKALSFSDAEAGGWDGWISLNGGSYGVTFDINNNTFSGYAWGSDVVGWLNFKPQYGGVIKEPSLDPNIECNDGVDNDFDGDIDYPNDLGCTDDSDDNESSAEFVNMSISADPVFVQFGNSALITWSAEAVNSCSVNGTNGDSWTGISGSESTSAISGETTYTLTCLDVEDHATDPQSVTVSLVPIFEEF